MTFTHAMSHTNPTAVRSESSGVRIPVAICSDRGTIRIPRSVLVAGYSRSRVFAITSSSAWASATLIPVTESAENPQWMRSAPQSLRIEAERQPDIEAVPSLEVRCLAHQLKILRQNADDGKRAVVQRKRLTDDGLIPSKPALPEGVAQNH